MAELATTIHETLWHALPFEDALRSLGVEPERGLTDSEVATRRETSGTNELPVEGGIGWWRLLFRQLSSPLIYVLLIAAGLTFWLHEYVDTIVILVVVTLNTAIGFYQEYRSEQTLVSLRRIVRVLAIVKRNGQLHRVDAAELVPGDIIELRAGAKIAADARIFSARDLAINEAILTGESAAVKKHPAPAETVAALGDRSSMVWMGTTIERGSGQAVVVATGTKTELGRIALLTKSASSHLTPLQLRLQRLANMISIAVVAAGLLILAVGALEGLDFVQSFETAVAVAVAAIPEGLVAALSVVLAVSTTRILKRKGLVRKPIAAETLGSTTVICADKTGTLTEGAMKVEHAFLEGDALPAFLALALANEAVIEESGDSYVFRGDTTDQAKLEFVLNKRPSLIKERSRFSSIAFLPFSSRSKYIATFVEGESSENVHCLVSGAPEILLDAATVLGDGKTITTDDRIRLLALQKKLASEGYRLIGVADRVLSKNAAFDDDEALRGHIRELTFHGIVALRDPIRRDVNDTLEVTRKAGIRVLMVTGDHELTASAIGRELGFPLGEGRVVNGSVLDALSDALLKDTVKRASVYCRVTPEHKLRIVRALIANGESVAMTGDGINDAPALRAADIGIATVAATDVTKEAADLVLLDDGLGTIASAVKEGRITFDNIRKVTLFLFSASFTELILIVGTLLFNTPLPLTPVMILWANVIQDGLPTFSLAFEPEEPNVMHRPPVSRSAAILTAQGKVIVFGTSIVRDLLLLSGFIYFTQVQQLDLAYVRTIIFGIISINPLLYIFSLRSLGRPLWVTGIKGNRFLLFTSIGSIALALSTMYLPFFNYFLGTVPLKAVHLLIILGVATFDVTTIEVVKRMSAHLTDSQHRSPAPSLA
ncbi:hypothetical protein COV04_00340 [Candidatus Uhrbacteria bacterium CG10_big_fil_rev_8_21_14_0_10_48_11]|uniref:Cation-transporting P-type ATPase N-terminal domain-containing protein n=1 Tax=Candidatus Uhrbacteria bacterium CG10_big_fil_rev_8_21_14_0_10_48_11 TaxID=1975037 RepID=A0A2M8LFT4_9BACT|nr:MAG: hypothetical protein COV04_00340 [Candidatus Uhrbacteria bacterium CG10_big_fil_rev_8_21_14_0_10_48_11]